MDFTHSIKEALQMRNFHRHRQQPLYFSGGLWYKIIHDARRITWTDRANPKGPRGPFFISTTTVHPARCLLRQAGFPFWRPLRETSV